MERAIHECDLLNLMQPLAEDELTLVVFIGFVCP